MAVPTQRKYDDECTYRTDPVRSIHAVPDWLRHPVPGGSTGEPARSHQRLAEADPGQPAAVHRSATPTGRASGAKQQRTDASASSRGPLMAKAKSKPISPDNPQERIEEHPAILIGKHPTKDTFLASYGQT
ncbi:hypothetical protein ALQ93_05196, partial [Pseudomonas syringae pv. pisi]